MALQDERSIGVNIAAHFDEGSLLNATRRIASMVEVLKQEMNGSDFHNYYKDVEALAKAVENAYRAFDSNRSQDNALNLVKAFNALAALDKSRLSNLSDLMPDLSGAVDSAKDLAGALANAFREENFREAFAAFDSIKENGGDVIRLFERVGQSAESTAELRREIERLGEAYVEAVAEADELREKVRELEDDSAVGKLKKQLDEAEGELSRIRLAAVEEFRTYLRANDINPLQTDKFGDRVFSKYLDQIRDGSMTAKQAIAAVKSEFASLFDDRGSGVGTEALGTISVRLDDILRKYEELSAQIREAGAAAPMERIGETAEAGSDAIERQGETIREVAGQRSAINDLNDLISMLVSISTQAEGSTSSLYEQIIPLLEAIREFDTIDPSKLQSIGKIFDGLSGINGFKISSAQAKNLKEFLDSVSTIGDISALRSISGVNLKGFSDLSINATSLKNLATYLPTIAGVNVENLEKLQHIDLSNFASLKIPKIDTEAISGLGKLGDALNQVRDSADALSKTIGAAGTSTARSLHQMSGAGLSHNAIASQLVTGLGANGTLTANTSLRRAGLTKEEADMITSSLEKVHANITKIEYDWKTFADGTKDTSGVVIKAVDEMGQVWTHKFSWDQVTETGEDGVERLTWRLKESGKAVQDFAAQERASAKATADAERETLDIMTHARDEIEKRNDAITRQSEQIRKEKEKEAEAERKAEEAAAKRAVAEEEEERAKIEAAWEALKAEQEYSDAEIKALDRQSEAEQKLYLQRKKSAESAVDRQERLDERAGAHASDAYYDQIEGIEKEKAAIEASRMSAEQARAELTRLQSLRLDFQNQLDKADEFGLDTKAVSKLRDQIEGIDDVIVVLKNVSQGRGSVELDAYADSLRRVKDQLVLLKKQLESDIKSTGAFVPMNDNQTKTALKTIDTRRKEAEQQLQKAAAAGLDKALPTFSAEGGLKDTPYNVLKNDLIPLYDELEKKVKAGAISQKEYNETLRMLASVYANVNTELNPEIQSVEELTKQYQKLEESMFKAQDDARNGVSGAWAEATNEQKSALNDLIAKQDALVTGFQEGTVTGFEYKTGIGEITEEYNNLTDAVNREYQARNKAHKDTLDEMNARRGLNQEISNASKLLRDYSAAEHSRNQSSRDAYKAIEDNITGMNELAARYERGEIDLKTLQEEQRRYSNEIAYNSAVIRQNGDDHMTAFDKIGRAIKTHLTTLTATASIGSIMRYIRQMVTAVREIDTAMTELRKVTDETDARYEQFLDNAATRAKNLSATISDTVSATADFARLGLSIDEAEKAADAAIVYKAVGDDIASIGDAAESIISTMKAFGVEAVDAMSIVDKFNKVGNEFAIGSSGVGEALKRSASAMQVANNTLEETIGLATAANTIIQNPASVGTMLKTVSMYIRAAKTELEEAGEDTEGIAESSAKLRELVKQITAEGGKAVDIMADENTFKSTYQILEEISEVWDKISDVNQGALLEKLGSKRNANALSAILKNFNIAREAMEAATRADGSAMAELAKYQQSIEGHVVALKTAFQELSNTVIDGDLVKFVVDFARVLLEAVNAVAKLIDKLGGLKTILVALTGILITRNIDNIIKKVDSFSSSISKAVIGLKTFNIGLSSTQIALSAVTAILTLAVAAYSAYMNQMRQYREEKISAAKTAAEESSEIDELIEKYKTLSKEVETDKSKKDDLDSTVDSLAEKLGIEQDIVDGLKGKYEELNGVLERTAELNRGTQISDLTEGFIQAQNKLVGEASGGENIIERIWRAMPWNSRSHGNVGGMITFTGLSDLSKQEQRALEKLYENGMIPSYRHSESIIPNPLGGATAFSLGLDTTTPEGSIAAYEKLGEIITELDKSVKGDSPLISYLMKIRTEIGATIPDVNTLGDSLNENLIERAFSNLTENGSVIPETAEEIDDLAQKITDVVTSNRAYAGTVDDVLKEARQYIIDTNNLVVDSEGKTVQQLTIERDALVKRTEALNNYISAYEDLVDIEQEAESAGYSDISERIFGNIDTDSRQILDWTQENIDKYRDILASWGYTEEDLQEMLGSFSTVMGTSMNFDGLEIAFSPILQTEDGPVLLSSDTVEQYISSLMRELGSDGASWTDEDLLRIDTRGLEIDGVTIKNLLASVGSEAIRVGEVMHYAGSDGALADAFLNMRSAANKAGVSLNRYRDRIGEVREEAENGEQAIEDLNRQISALANQDIVAPDYQKDISAYVSKIGALTGAWREFQENGKITSQTYQLLNKEFEDESGLVEIVNGKLSLNADAVEKLNEKLRDEYGLKVALAGASEEEISYIDRLAGELENLSSVAADPTSELKELTGVLGDMAEGVELGTFDILELIQKYPQLRDKIIKTANGYKVEESAIRDLIKVKSQLLTLNEREIGITSARAALISDKGETPAQKIDKIFADFEAANGRAITSAEDFAEGYLNEFGKIYAGSYDTYQNYVNALIDLNNGLSVDANALAMVVEDLNSEVKERYDPTKEEKSSSAADKEETAFEKAYKLHQHYLAMDQETEEQYLSWLEGAYKASYAAGEMELDDYYKYEEEVYEKRKALFSQSLDETQHQIDLLSHQMGDTSQEQIALYEQMQKKVNQQANAYRAAGIKENDELIRELQNQWWQYEENIRQLRENAFSDWLNDKKFLIDQLKQDGASSDEILNSWKEVLSRINDEIAYYLSKGYDITSDVIQNLMGELKDAKDSITDALDEIVSKANEVVDGFQNVYTTLTNAAKEYASTGYLSVDSLQSILELGPKYMDMLYDESGQLTINEEALQKVIAARTEEMAAETALSYAKQVLLATEGDESQKLRDLTNVQAASSSATWDMAYATLGYAKALGASKGISEDYYDKAIQYVTRMQSVTKTATDSISDYYKTLDEGYVSQADGLETILKLTEDMIKQENSDRIKQLEDEKDAYKDIIDQKKEILRLTKEQNDHDRDMADRLKEISDLQSKIDQLALDDSREARAQRSKLEAELLEKQKSLTDSQNDYAYDAQVDALDKQYDEYEKELDKESEALKDELNSAEKLYRAAIDRISNGWDTLYDDLLRWNYNYGNTLEKDLTNAWKAAQDAAERYGDFVSAMEGVKQHDKLGDASSTPTTEAVQNAVAGGASTFTNYRNRMYENSLAWYTADNPAFFAAENQRLAKEYEGVTGNRLTHDTKSGYWYENGSSDPFYTLDRNEVGMAVVAAMKANSEAWKGADPSTQRQLAEKNQDLADKLAAFLKKPITKTAAGVWMLGNTPLYEVTKFHTGGIVGGRGSLRQNEVMSLLKKGEAVLDERREEALYKTVDFVQMLSDKIGHVIDKGRLSSLLAGTGASFPKGALPALAGGGIGTMNFSPTIQVTITGAGDLTEAAARKYGNIAAESALAQLKNAFTQRGVSAPGNSILK